MSARSRGSRPGHAALGAHLLGLLDLDERQPRRADREEQLGIGVPAEGVRHASCSQLPRGRGLTQGSTPMSSSRRVRSRSRRWWSRGRTTDDVRRPRKLGHGSGDDKGYRARRGPGSRGAMTDVIAHRGASRLAPENTIEAFELAVAVGADGIELDVRRTADGVLVVHHDARLPDGRAIVELPWHELPPARADARRRARRVRRGVGQHRDQERRARARLRPGRPRRRRRARRPAPSGRPGAG